ncbi:MAG: NepR family anti-sigma factor [Hyphomicrobiaceae bacterium]
MPGNENKEMDKRVEAHELENTGEQSLPPEIQASIGRQLKRAYAEIVSEPLPDRFSKLLNDLARSNKKSGDDS